MQSVNEELETSSEELQSTNEELSSRNAELGQLSDDLHNLLTSVSLPIILVDRGGCVRHITPEAYRLFRVTPGDLGRPVAELAQRLGIDDLDGLVREVVQALHPLERTLRDDAGRWYVAHVRPTRPPITASMEPLSPSSTPTILPAAMRHSCASPPYCR